MSKPEIKCPKCRKALTNIKVAEMVAREPLTWKKLLVRRFPRGECPEHGMFYEEEYEIAGHHVTMKHLKDKDPRHRRATRG